MLKKIFALFALVFIFGCTNSCGMSYKQYKVSATVSEEVLEPYLASVSLININQDDRIFCSGTIIKNDKGNSLEVLTAAHCVLQDPEEEQVPLVITTKYDDNKRYMKIKKADADHDLALIVGIDDEKKDGPYVDIAPKPPILASMAWVIGNPGGSEGVITKGVISKIEDVVDETDDGRKVKRNIYRTDCAVSYGNSGGLLANEKGELIGVVVAVKLVANDILISIDGLGVFPIPGLYALSITPGGGLAVGLKDVKAFLK
jgi:S1-C subfamily serine protease